MQPNLDQQVEAVKVVFQMNQRDPPKPRSIRSSISDLKNGKAALSLSVSAMLAVASLAAVLAATQAS